MYETYWNFSEKPFENGWDSRFYYPSEAHQGALLKLRYGVENQRGLVVLSGAAGTGKTMIVQSLLAQLPESQRPAVHVIYPLLATGEMLAYLAGRLGAPAGAGRTADISVERLESVLAENSRRGRHAVVVVDEAHLLADEVLEALRLLLGFGQAGRPCLTVILVGEPPLLTRLDRMPSVEQRVGIKSLLRPLDLEETASYVAHRTTAAGADQPIFHPEAVQSVFELTGGVPLRINRLCDLALLVGFAEECGTITAEQIDLVAGELVTVSPE
jgi:general secretion pathway protein A